MDLILKKKVTSRLGKIGDTKAVLILIKALDDSDRFARKSAARSLGKIKDGRAIKPLIRVLGFVDPEFRYAAKDSLVEIGKQSENDLINALESKNYHQREMAVEALGELGSEDSIEFLKKGLSDNESQVRWRAARAVNHQYNDDIIVILKKMLKNDPDIKVRDESAKSLKTIENQVKKLYETFLKSIRFIGEDILIQSKKNGKSFLVNGKIFCSSYSNNPLKIHIHLYKGNISMKEVKNMKDSEMGDYLSTKK